MTRRPTNLIPCVFYASEDVCRRGPEPYTRSYACCEGGASGGERQRTLESGLQ